MNERLEIAARYLILTSDNLSPSFRSIAKSACDDALFWADSLIAAELETRPKEPECEHASAWQSYVPTHGQAKYRRCQQCGTSWAWIGDVWAEVQR